MHPDDSDSDKDRGRGNDEHEDQGQHRGQNKDRPNDPRNEEATWCMDDVEWDANGCLYIKNPELAELIRQAIWVDKDFCIVADNPNYDPADPDGGGGGPQVNIQCPC